MADTGNKPVQMKTAQTRKHLRRDQAVSKKSKVVVTDTIKERLVSGKRNSTACCNELCTRIFLQQKQKEEKEAKRATFDARHQHIFGTLATKLRITETEIEDLILDGSSEVSCPMEKKTLVMYKLSYPSLL